MKRALGFLAVLILLFLGFVATRPDTYHVERSITIAAPAASVFGLVADFREWPKWSPWEKLDPAMKRELTGPAGEVGSRYAWVGNDKVGEGNMTLTEVQPPNRMAMRLEFIKPFHDISTATFTCAESAGSTRITWAMDGKFTFLSKLFCLFMPMDKTVGGDFEKGLAQLKQLGEASAGAAGGVGTAPAAPDSAAHN